MRSKGQTWEHDKMRETKENHDFAITHIDQELRLIEVRVGQAITREPGLTALLEPALEKLEYVREKIRKVS
jgi:hypothetical protein